MERAEKVKLKVCVEKGERIKAKLATPIDARACLLPSALIFDGNTAVTKVELSDIINCPST